MISEDKRQELKDRIKDFPQSFGVYLMKNLKNQIIYVGKAKNIRSRTRSYFVKSESLTIKTKHLVNKIISIDYILTRTEVEAFLLEASLIKKHQPKYNIRLKDDKSYPYICLSIKDEFPRFYLARKVESNGSLYFGPYTSGLSVRETIRFMNQSFMIRDCSDHFMKSRKRPCMTHQIGRCTAPCVNLVNKKEYAKDVNSALDFLKEDSKKAVLLLKKSMKEVSKQERFEAAAKIRDSISGIESVWEKQSVVNAKTDRNQDVIACVGDSRGTLIEVLHIRRGRVIGNRFHFLRNLDITNKEEDPREWLTSFINQYYTDNVVSDEIILPHDLGSDIYTLLSEVFYQRQKVKPDFIHALGPDESKLVSMAEMNARSHFLEYVNKQGNINRYLEEIQEKFCLSKKPLRIECYDISNFQGSDSVASQVVFEDGIPKRSDYRKYKIKTVQGANDFASLQEVLRRRFQHTEYDDPDLVIVDGGKGQLRMSVEILKEINREDIPVAGMAKARTQGEFFDAEIKSSEERFFLPGRKNSIKFPKNSGALNILIQIRNEAHRFAIQYHRLLRKKSSLESELDSISGIGEKRKQALIKHFGDIESIRQSNIDEIALVEGFNLSLSKKVFFALN